MGHWLSIALLLVIALPCACGDDEDPIRDACEASCAIDQSNTCFDKHSECLSKCVAKAEDASANGYKPTECATCMAGLVGYSPAPDNQSCYGVQVPTDFKDPACASVCQHPDDT